MNTNLFILYIKFFIKLKSLQLDAISKGECLIESNEKIELTKFNLIFFFQIELNEMKFKSNQVKLFELI